VQASNAKKNNLDKFQGKISRLSKLKRNPAQIVIDLNSYKIM